MSLLNMRQLNAFWTLGWALVKHVVARPFIGRRVPDRWLARLRDESLGAVPPLAWKLFEGSSRCTACGACEVTGALGDAPMRWILSVARQPGDAPLARQETERLAALDALLLGGEDLGVGGGGFGHGDSLHGSGQGAGAGPAWRACMERASRRASRTRLGPARPRGLGPNASAGTSRAAMRPAPRLDPDPAPSRPRSGARPTLWPARSTEGPR